MRPVSGGLNPYDRSFPPPGRPFAPAGRPSLRAVYGVVHPTDRAPAGDVELSVRVLADGGSITVRRQSAAAADGTRRTVGIDAVVR